MVKDKNLFFVIVKYGIMLVFACNKCQASLDCNFENGYCGWQQETSEEFVWRRVSSSTQEKGRPNGDHTNGIGYYIYIEASYGNTGYTARLRSPEQESGQYCLTFWYSMYGSNIGSLNVYIKSNGTREKRKYSNNGSVVTSDDWRNAVLSISVSERYKIVLEGIRGDGDSSGIAVDDIALTTGTCADCNFDNGICYWRQSESIDEFDWMLQKGETPTPGTGPTADHTSKNGEYIFIESASRSKGDKASIMSPFLPGGKYCFSFWFYMYGGDVDRLTVGVLYKSFTSQELFSRTGNQGQKWIQENVLIHTTTYFMIIFEGRVNNTSGYKGDIALDDVLMLPCHDCDNPTPKYAVSQSTNFTYGSVIEIKCDKGYSLIGESKMVCQAGGSWNVSRPTCVKYDCGNRTIPNGTFIAPNGTTFGETASHVCSIGYAMVGDKNVVCTASGWNGTVANCTVVDCADPTPNHAVANSTNFEYGSFVEVTCDRGYNLIGHSLIVCQANGSWSAIQPTCKSGNTENSALTAIYVLVPVVIVSAILFTTFILRRRYPKCQKNAEAKEESQNNPTLELSNRMHGALPKSQIYTNQHGNEIYYDYAAETEDRSPTIDTSDTVYNITGAEQVLEMNDGHNYDHLQKSGNVQCVSESYSHLPGSSKTNVKCLLQHEDTDYDHAFACRLDTIAPEYDDYSHLNDVIKNKICPPTNSDHVYTSVTKIKEEK